MLKQTRYLLPEEAIPTSWYNLAADLPKPPPPVLHPGTHQPIGPDDLAPLFPMAVIGQEVSTERFIPIPEEVLAVYRLWRPTPLYRAHRLERAFDLPESVRIFYKYEGGSPAGSHKPNTAVPQAYYAKQEGVKRIATETGAGQWGSALALAGSLFDLEIKVYMVKISYAQKPYRRALMETWGAQCVASPSTDTNAGRDDPRPGPRLERLPGDRHLGSGRGRRHARRYEVRPGIGAEPRPPAPDRDRAGGAAAAGDGGRLSGRRHRLCRWRLELRRHQLPIRAPEAGGEADSHRRRRARGVPDVDQRHLRLRFRRHRSTHAAGEDAHPGTHLRSGRDPRRRIAIPRRGAVGEHAAGRGTDRGDRHQATRGIRGSGALRPHGRDRSRAGAVPCHPRRDR